MASKKSSAVSIFISVSTAPSSVACTMPASSSGDSPVTISRAASIALSFTASVTGRAAPNSLILALFSALAISPLSMLANISSGLAKPVSLNPLITALKKSIILSNNVLVVPTTFS